MTPAPRGYIALVSVLILCTVLSTLTFAIARSAYFARFGALAAEDHAAARALADGCIQAALLAIGESPDYRPQPRGDLVWVTDRATCTIDSIAAPGMTYTIRAHARVRGSVGAVETVAVFHPGSSPLVTIKSWKEIDL